VPEETFRITKTLSRTLALWGYTTRATKRIFIPWEFQFGSNFSILNYAHPIAMVIWGGSILLPLMEDLKDTLPYLVGDHIIVERPVGEICIGDIIHLTFGKQA
jgi:hypothetical protein